MAFVAQPGRHRTTAHGDQQEFGIQRLSATQLDPDPVAGGFGALEPHAQLEADAAAAEFPLEQLGAGLVFQRNQVRQRLDNGHLAAERGPRRGELAADDPAAEHDRGGRHPVERQGVFAGYDPVPVQVQPRQGTRVRAGGKHHVRSGVSVRTDLHCPAAGQQALAVHDLDTTALDQAGQPLMVLRDHRVLVLVDPGHVDAFERRLHPERRALPRLVGDLPGVQERLGRDAATMQARPAYLVLLHKYHGLAQLSSPQRGRVAAAAAAENHQVAPVVCHGYSSYSLTLRRLA